MDVTDEEQAKIAEQAGACAVMALQKVPADIIRDGGVARMASPTVIKKIKGQQAYLSCQGKNWPFCRSTNS